MEKTYRLEEARPDAQWDKFVAVSANGTIFSNSVYLTSCTENHRLYYCFKGGELRAGIALIEDETGKSAVLDDLIIYNGIIYNRPTHRQNSSQKLSEKFKLQEFIATRLTRLYQNVEMRLDPSIVDIRPILWVNYGLKKPAYIPDIRYTAYMDISDFRTAGRLEDISSYNNASTSRRQQIRYSAKKGYTTRISSDTGQLIHFYKKTMDRQGKKVDTLFLLKMERLAGNLLSNKMATIYVSYDDNGEPGSMALMGWDAKRAYYLFGANDPEKRSGHCGTAVLWDAFDDLSKKGMDEVDLEGVNSPHRGWFKLSFGGNILPYFSVSYRGEQQS